MVKKIQAFVSDVRTEMGKVSWPTREELVNSTTVVLTTMFFLSCFIGIVDFFMAILVRIFLR